MDLLIFFGGTVKAEGDGKFRAPLVTFGSPDATDVTGEYFTVKTNFWQEFPASVPLLYHHGMDAKIGLSPIGVGGKAKLTRDDAGVWMAGQLNMADEYEKRIYQLIEAGKMGTSSGSAPHMVVRKTAGKAIEILSWPLVEGSLTPTPAEWRNRAVTVKSLDELKGFFQSDPGEMQTDPFAGVGVEMTASGLRSLFDRVMMACWDCLRNGKATEMDAILSRFAEMARVFVAGMAAMDAEDAQDMFDMYKARPETLREFERGLREQFRLSRAEAKTVAAHGFNALLRDAASENEETAGDTAAIEREAARRELARLELAGLAAAGV